ncbi:MAG: glutamate racemase [Candidatus Saccharibacteria bacterium]
MKIGVFDSGVGGLSVAKAIELALPNDQVVLREDSENLPYGNKTPQQLYDLVLPLLKGLVDEGCQVIVVACNTVTTTIIGQLRQTLTVPLVGIEPMIKPAALQTKSGIIAVCATPTTLASDRYKWLKNEYATGMQVLEPDCSDWSTMIENNQINHSKIAERIESVCQKGADVIVLACTHYHWIQDTIDTIAGDRAVVIQPEDAIIAQLKRVMAQIV